MSHYWVVCNGIYRGKYSDRGYRKIVPYDNLDDARKGLVTAMTADRVREGMIVRSLNGGSYVGTAREVRGRFVWIDRNKRRWDLGMSGRIRRIDDTNVAGIP